MNKMTNKTEYIEYLLKNYHYLLNRVEQMKIELENYEFESEDETITGLTLCGNSLSTVHADNNIIKDETARISLIYKNVNKRLTMESKKIMEKEITYCETELRKLMTAIDSLPEDTKNVIKDLYIQRYKWEQIALRRYISTNTINRHRRKGIEEIVRCFFVGESVA